MEKFDEPSEMYEEPLDNLSAYDDEEPDRRATEPSHIYEEPVDNLSMYDDEEPDRPGTEPPNIYEEPIDNLSMYDDEEPDRPGVVLEVIGAKTDDVEEGKLFELCLYEEPVDNLSIYDDEEPNRQVVLPKHIDAKADDIEEGKLIELCLYEEPVDNLSIYDDEEPNRQDVLPKHIDAKADDIEEEKLIELCLYEEPVDNLSAYDDEEPYDIRNGLPAYKDKDSKRLKTSQGINKRVDSLILGKQASRRKSQSDKKKCRDSFPVTITEVTDLGANSLYVKWIIHDCCGIVGYEIYTDGYLTNRLYNSKHEAAVITNVDVTTTHRITLLAKARTLPWESNTIKDRKALCSCWIPSIYLYTPRSCPANV